MAHLIQPLDVDGTTYCVIYNGNRSTELVNTELVSTPTDLATIETQAELWHMPITGIVSSYEVSFGVGCGSLISFQFEITTSSTDWDVVIDVHINGNPVAVESLIVRNTDGAGTYPLDVDISDVPCGNVISVTVGLRDEDTEDIVVSARIVSIT